MEGGMDYLDWIFRNTNRFTNIQRSRTAVPAGHCFKPMIKVCWAASYADISRPLSDARCRVPARGSRWRRRLLIFTSTPAFVGDAKNDVKERGNWFWDEGNAGENFILLPFRLLPRGECARRRHRRSIFACISRRCCRSPPQPKYFKAGKLPLFFFYGPHIYPHGKHHEILPFSTP